jgi:aspartokinase
VNFRNLHSALAVLEGDTAAAGLTTDAFSDFVVGHGELWCARLFAASMRLKGHNAKMLDARDVLVVEPTSDGQSVDVDYEASERNLDKWAEEHGDVDVIIGTGFIARDTKKQVIHPSCGKQAVCEPVSASP